MTRETFPSFSWPKVPRVLGLILLGVSFILGALSLFSFSYWGLLAVILLATVGVVLFALRLSFKPTGVTVYARRTFASFRWHRILAAVVISLTPSVLIYHFHGFLKKTLDIFVNHITSTGITVGVYATTFGVVVALTTWIFAQWATRRRNQRQHTVNVLVQHRFNADFENHLSTITARFPTSDISEKEAKALILAMKRKGLPDWKHPQSDSLRSRKAVFESIRIVLNYYEFLEVGIKRGDLDARVMEDFYGTMLCPFCERVREVIRCLRTKPHGDLRFFENLVDLYKTWKPSWTFPELDEANVRADSQAASEQRSKATRTRSTKKPALRKKKRSAKKKTGKKKPKKKRP